VDRRRTHTEILEVAFDAIAGAFRLAEHERLRHAASDCGNDTIFVHVMHSEEQVMHAADRVGGGIDRDLDRVFHVARDQMGHIAVEGRREEHRLVRSSDLAQDPFDLRRKTIVGHAIGLVEHHDLDSIELQFVFLQQVDEAQRCRNHNIDAELERVDLLLAGRAAIDGKHGSPARNRDRRKHLSNLQRQLACRHHHQCCWSPGFADLGEARQHRNTERQRLAAARLRATAHVATSERDRYRFGLNREGRCEPGRRKAEIDGRWHAELDERGGDVILEREGQHRCVGGTAVLRRFWRCAAAPLSARRT